MPEDDPFDDFDDTNDGFDDDEIDGCDVDMADPHYVSTDRQVDALMMFGDLPVVGWHTDEEDEGRRPVPTVDPDALRERIDELRALDA